MMTLNLIPLTGAVGPRGIMGLKGDPGESISIPEAMVSPNIQTVSETRLPRFTAQPVAIRGPRSPGSE